MQRRSLLKLGIASAVLLTLAGGVAVMLQPGLQGGKLTPAGRALFASVGRAILQGTLPAEPQAAAQALAGLVDRIDALVIGLPPHVQAELSQLVGLLCTAAGRRGLAGLDTDWSSATAQQVQAALQHMRQSSLALRQQTYQALHEIVGGAYFSDSSTWAVVGYPGPVTI
jgi:hypothetical protein